MCSYYRSFVPNYSEIAEPLYALRKKRTKFVWSSETQDAFQKMKLALSQAPTLKHAEHDKPFIIHTDASTYGVGAVIQQDGRPIAYTSRTLNAAERNYTTTEREILAIVEAIKRFKTYLSDKPVTVITDHAALTKLYTGKNLTPRVIRWALFLQEYNIEIQHRPGKENKVADALSRAPYHDEKVQCAMLTTFVLDQKEQIKEELLKDPEFADIYEYLVDPDSYTKLNKRIIENRAAHYELIDNLLFYKLHKNIHGEYRPVIPRSLRMEVLKGLHDLPVCGHMGIRKTFSRARMAVYWPNLKEYVSQYVRSCDTCQKINYINYSPAGYLTNISATFPNEIVGIDLLGPYPRSNAGKYRYILVIVDHFSKWVEIIPLKRASAKTVTDSFLNRYVYSFGTPHQIISDNGCQFSSQVFTEMCHRLNIKHVKMVTYRPQSNIAERTNRTIVKLISAYVAKYHTQWDVHLNEFAFAIRTAPHDSTSKTPAEIFLGRKIMTPIDRLFFVKGRECQFSPQDLQELFKEVKIKNDQMRATQKRYYDRKRRESDIKVGDLVLRITHSVSVAKEKVVGKFCPKFEGPFKVVKLRGNVVTIDKEGKLVVANVDQIKRYYVRSEMPLFKETPCRVVEKRPHSQVVEQEEDIGPRAKRTPPAQLKALAPPPAIAKKRKAEGPMDPRPCKNRQKTPKAATTKQVNRQLKLAQQATKRARNTLNKQRRAGKQPPAKPRATGPPAEAATQPDQQPPARQTESQTRTAPEQHLTTSPAAQQPTDVPVQARPSKSAKPGAEHAQPRNSGQSSQRVNTDPAPSKPAPQRSPPTTRTYELRKRKSKDQPGPPPRKIKQAAIHLQSIRGRASPTRSEDRHAASWRKWCERIRKVMTEV